VSFLRTLSTSLLWAIMPALLQAAPKPIDVEKSAITIQVGKSGFFSAFAHNHVVRALLAEGAIEENGAKPHVEFRVDARQLKVLDPETKPEERAEIQRDMQGPKVLDSEKYPEIRFRSTTIERAGEGKWKVSGELTLHGQTHPVEATATGSNGRYRGSTSFKQTQFGITPIAVAGGTVKVKDELRIEFEIIAQ
jgi:polyisoprenoid-binding protein YceI